jgi:tetratricopeptide (TPR) repeat protein
MAIDLSGAMRRVLWNANKRTLEPSPRLEEKFLDRVRELHAHGAYEDGIEVITGASSWEADSQAWRLIGLCALGLRRYPEAHTAFAEAIRLNTLEVAKDEINNATALLNETAYDEAEQAAERARVLAPAYVSPIVCLLSIYNRTRRHDDITRLISAVKVTQPELLSDPDFLERLANDTDLIGISTIVASLTL